MPDDPAVRTYRIVRNTGGRPGLRRGPSPRSTASPTSGSGSASSREGAPHAPRPRLRPDAELPPAHEPTWRRTSSSSTLLGAMAPATRSCTTSPGRRCYRACADPDAITYRQAVLADCLDQPEIIRELYRPRRRGPRGREDGLRLAGLRDTPDSLLTASVQVLEHPASTSCGACAEIADAHAADVPLGGARAALHDARRRAQTTTTSPPSSAHLRRARVPAAAC